MLPVLLLLLAALLLGRGSDGGMTAEEKRVARALSSARGVGSVHVTFYYEEAGGAFGSAKKISGALVVAEGADDMSVRLGLTQAVETLLSLPPGRVMVLQMEEQ